MSNITKGFSIVTALIVTTIIAVVIIPIVVAITRYTSSQRQETITVSKSERVVDSNGRGSRYLIYTKQGVYQDTDSLLFWKFNSSDLYNQLEQNKSYRCLVVGWRVPFLSWYPNLVNCGGKN